MAGDLQTVPARHGVATFVPARHTIKVINTYGTQTVDMWAFALGRPPPTLRPQHAEREDEDEDEEGGEDETRDVRMGQEEEEEQEEEGEEGEEGEGEAEAEAEAAAGDQEKPKEGRDASGGESEGAINRYCEKNELREDTRGRVDAQPEQERGTRDSSGEKDVGETTAKASHSKGATAAPVVAPEKDEDEDDREKQQKQHQMGPPKPPARSWSAYASYVPSLRRSRSKKATSAVDAATDKEEKMEAQTQTPQKTVSSYAAYLPSLRARAKEAAAPPVVADKTDDGGGNSGGGGVKEKEEEKDKGKLKEDDGSLQSASDYVSAGEGGSQEVKNNDDDDSGQGGDKVRKNNMSSSVMSTKSWGSYLPSIPIRKPGSNGDRDAAAPTLQTTQSSPTAQQSTTSPQKKNNNAKDWLSYIPSGKSFTSYLPPKGKEVLSAFAASHYRDPNKSYGEQLYEFSRTPVGAFGLSAATGSGTAGSLYAAYNAYVKLQATRRSPESMEYLSLPHTAAASTHLAPQVGDALVTNLRSPLLTLLEDTTPASSSTSSTSSSNDDSSAVPLRHGTLLPACDPTVYAQLALIAGHTRGEEHGSCAENLVLALQSFNKSTKLQGVRAVGADVTINSAPTPLSLFLNSRVDGATGEVRVAGPRTYESGRMGRPGQKGGYVMLRAERDLVVVLSACPMDVGEMNGGRCMAANFMVEEPPSAAADEQQAADDGNDEAKQDAERLERARAYGRALGAMGQKGGSSAPGAVGVPGDAVKSTETLDASAGGQSPLGPAAGNRSRAERKKPRKLERRNGSAPVK